MSKGRIVVLMLAHDATERKRSEDRNESLAYHDALIGLPNRTLFEDRLQMALSSAKRRREKVAVMFLDIDNFKHINDTRRLPASNFRNLPEQFLMAIWRYANWPLATSAMAEIFRTTKRHEASVQYIRH